MLAGDVPVIVVGRARALPGSLFHVDLDIIRFRCCPLHPRFQYTFARDIERLDAVFGKVTLGPHPYPVWSLLVQGPHNFTVVVMAHRHLVVVVMES